jgi:hypothetical protein
MLAVDVSLCLSSFRPLIKTQELANHGPRIRTRMCISFPFETICG